MRSRILPLLALSALITLSGCGNPFEMDPSTTVIIKVSGIPDEAEKERIYEKAKELVIENSTWHKSQISQHGKTTMIKVSPVEEVQDYADRITFGKVTAVDRRTITVEAVGAVAELAKSFGPCG